MPPAGPSPSGSSTISTRGRRSGRRRPRLTSSTWSSACSAARVTTNRSAARATSLQPLMHRPSELGAARPSPRLCRAAVLPSRSSGRGSVWSHRGTPSGRRDRLHVRRRAASSRCRARRGMPAPPTPPGASAGGRWLGGFPLATRRRRGTRPPRNPARGSVRTSRAGGTRLTSSTKPSTSSAAAAITIAPPGGTLPRRVWMLPRSSRN